MEIPPGIPIDQVPGMKPPPGVTPNFAHPPDDYQSTIVATLAVCLTVATLLSAMRLYAKAYIIKSFALEDCKVLFVAHFRKFQLTSSQMLLAWHG